MPLYVEQLLLLIFVPHAHEHSPISEPNQAAPYL
jgi:hypothetical protein